MNRSTYQACILCLALERFEPETEQEQEAKSALLYRFSRDLPYAPHRSATVWYARRP